MKASNIWNKISVAWQRLPAGWRAVLFCIPWMVIWLDPSSGLTRGILWLATLYGLAHWKRVKAAWCNPAGLFMGLGVMWAVCSIFWSFDSYSTGRDLVRDLGVPFLVLALPGIFHTRQQIWRAFLVSAGIITANLAVDWWHQLAGFGWPAVLQEARYVLPHIYAHPNNASMLAVLCILIFGARLVAGVGGHGWKAVLLGGLFVNVWYLFALASRAPQASFAIACLITPVFIVPGWKSKLILIPLLLLAGFGMWRCMDVVNPRFDDETMPGFHRRSSVWEHSKMLVDEYCPWVGFGHGKKVFHKAIYENPNQRHPNVPVRFPHAHRYWLMMYFQGGRIAVLLWGLGWLCMLFRFVRRSILREHSPCAGWWAHIQARALPAMVLAGLVTFIVYGLVDYPDGLARDAQFYLIGFAMALAALPPLLTETVSCAKQSPYER